MLHLRSHKVGMNATTLRRGSKKPISMSLRRAFAARFFQGRERLVRGSDIRWDLFGCLLSAKDFDM